MRKLATAIILSGLLTVTAAWSQQPTPKGDQFQVNTYTTSNQGNPSVAVGPLGNFIVVWQSTGSFGNDTSGDSIQPQRYDANGTPLGAQFQVNTSTNSRQESAKVAFDGQGNFVVVWDHVTEGSARGQMYDKNGAAVGGKFQIETSGYGSRPAVVADSVGNFVVAWTGAEAAGTDNSDSSIPAQRYDLNSSIPSPTATSETRSSTWMEPTISSSSGTATIHPPTRAPEASTPAAIRPLPAIRSSRTSSSSVPNTGRRRCPDWSVEFAHRDAAATARPGQL